MIYTSPGLVRLLEYLLVFIGAIELFHLLVRESHLERLNKCMYVLTKGRERERSDVVFYS